MALVKELINSFDKEVLLFLWHPTFKITKIMTDNI